MYRVMIVEDEVPVRNAICSIIEWKELGYDLVYAAGDGQDAIDYLETNSVDVILSDICMPFIDGLELSRRAKAIIPTVKIVIFTGYNEFEYAQNAIEIGVSHYLLKPITAEEFKSMLIKVKDELDKEHEEKRDLIKLRMQVKHNKKLLTEKFILNLVTNKISNRLISQKINNLELSIEGTEYRVAILQSENYTDISLREEWDNDVHLYDFAVLNICNEIIGQSGLIKNVVSNDGQVIILLSNHNMVSREFNKKIEEVLNNILFYTKKFYNINMFVALGDSYKELKDIHYSYNDALIALEYSVLFGSGKIIYKSDIERRSSCSEKEYDDLLKELEYSIKMGKNDKINKLIDYLFSSTRFSEISINVFRTICLRMTTTIIKAYEDLMDEKSKELNIDFSQFNEVFEKNRLEEVKEYYKKLCVTMANDINKERNNSRLSLINQARDYIYDNYDDINLDINAICEYLNVSSSYFSRLFKKEVNATCIEYITTLRMDKAKELLDNTSMKIYEIAKRIGYENPYYFSYNFKKRTGLKPTQYRMRDNVC